MSRNSISVLIKLRCGTEALPMVAGSVAGGYAAAHGAQRIDQRLIKGLIIVLGAGLTVLFFWSGV